MEHRNLKGLYWSNRILLRLVALFASVALTPQAQAQSSLPADPELLCIYKVNDKCPDTILVGQHPNNVSLRPLSKTQCPVKLGLGSAFYTRSCALILNGNILALMFSALHKDDMLRLDTQEPQQFTNGYGAYRVLVRSREMLYDSLLVYNIRFKPESAPGSSVDLRYSPALGVISIHNLDRQNATLGKVELVKVNGKSLEQFIKAGGK